MRKALLVCVVNLAAASAAFGDLAFATNASYTPTGLGEFVNGSGADLQNVDGNAYTFSYSHHSMDLGLQPTFTFTVLFGGAVKPSGDPNIILYMSRAFITNGPASALLVTDAEWQDSIGGGSASLTTLGSGYDMNTGSMSARVNHRLPGSGDPANYTTSGGFSFSYFDRLVLTIQIAGQTGDDAFLYFDAVSNPEPGTLALFGLGALGLGGLAWRRRARRAAPKA